MKRNLAILLMLACCVALFVPEMLSAARRRPQPEAPPPIAKMVVNGSNVWFDPVVAYGALDLTFALPDGTVREARFVRGEIPNLSITPDMPDGVYAYELRLTPPGTLRTRSEEDPAAEQASTPPLVQNGSFHVTGGKILQNDAAGGAEVQYDIVQADDVIIQGSLGVGLNSVVNQSFGFDTIRLSEDNTRIKFDDASTTAGFPANDWQLTANDSSSGGSNYFAIDDVTGSKTPFKVTAGAPSNSFFMDSSGRIGLKTATPILDLHINTNNTPAFRLEQNSSGGFTAQTWDIAGNEANFFVRDVTGGSRLPFRIRPGAPTSSIDIRENGNVGFGTSSPYYCVHVQRTGANAAVMAQRTDGAANYMNAGPSYANFGSANNYPLRLTVNASWRLQLNTDNSLAMVNGATCTAGGVWTDSSSREVKDNISALSSQEAIETLDGLSPVKFNYKADQTERYVGFIAEEVPDLVAMKDRKSLSPMDIIAVLTKVVQEQQQHINELNQKLSALEAKVR